MTTEIMKYRPSFCEFCKTKGASEGDLLLKDDDFFGDIYLCKSCNQNDIIESKKEKSIKTHMKLIEISKDIRKKLDCISKH